MSDGPRAPIIDIHAHTTPKRFRDAVESGQRWHGLGPEFGELENPRNLLTPAERIEEMDELAVDIQTLSSTDCFYQYDNDPKTTLAIAREANDELADIQRDHPERYFGLGTLPMQDVPTAVVELSRVMEELELKGVMIDDHVRNKPTKLMNFFPSGRPLRRLARSSFFTNMRPPLLRTEPIGGFSPIPSAISLTVPLRSARLCLGE